MDTVDPLFLRSSSSEGKYIDSFDDERKEYPEP